jgi:hypothetical protein
MDGIDLNSRRDDDSDDSLDTNVNTYGWVTPKDDKDCSAQRDPILAENVGVSTLLPYSST